MLYRPLFWTSYWCEDWLHASGYRGGAQNVLISSASAKTAFTLAHCIRTRRAEGGQAKTTPRIVGLTSSRNLAFTKNLGLYDEVLTYDDVESSPIMKPATGQKWIYADVASVATLNKRIFAHFAPTRTLVAGITLGMSTVDPADAKLVAAGWTGVNEALATHGVSHGQDQGQGPAVLSAADMESFFMVEWLALRRRQLSVMEIAGMQKTAWEYLLRVGREWVRIERVHGGVAVQRAYARIVKGSEGGLGPDTGFVWSMWEEEDQARFEKEKVRAKL
jgi:hypothetical protein